MLRQPLRVALLCSRRAPGLADLLDDPRRGIEWDLVLGPGADASAVVVRCDGVDALATTAAGVRTGTSMPHHVVTSNPG